jgi:hypothetical protein
MALELANSPEWKGGKLETSRDKDDDEPSDE